MNTQTNTTKSNLDAANAAERAADAVYSANKSAANLAGWEAADAALTDAKAAHGAAVRSATTYTRWGA